MGISEDIRDCLYSALSRMLERTEELFSNPEIKKLSNIFSFLLVLLPRLTVPVCIAFRHQGDLYFTIIHFEIYASLCPIIEYSKAWNGGGN